MRSTIIFRNSRRRLLGAGAAGALAAQLLLAGAAILPMTGASEALPRTCIIRSYYNNAELDTQVGMRSSCPGARRWGKVSKFVEVETIDLVPEGPAGGGGGGLPCEFLGGEGTGLECNNLPKPRP